MNQSTHRITRNKLGLLNLAEELGNVSKACQMMGVSRDTFYRYQSARDDGGVEALLEKTRRKPNPKNRVEPQIEQAVLDFALEYPAHGQVRVSNELRKLGVFVSASGVRSIWLRHTLQSRNLRLKALEAKVANEGIVLTEAQVVAMERQRATLMRFTARLSTPGIFAHRTHTMWARSKVSVASTSRRLSTRTAKLPRASCTRPKRRSPLQICSTIVYCRCSKTMVST